MSDLLTPAELAAIAEREAKATKGPWVLRHDGWTIRDSKGERQIAHTYCRDGSLVEQQVSDAEFIAEARADIPALLRHIAALEARTPAPATDVDALLAEAEDEAPVAGSFRDLILDLATALRESRAREVAAEKKYHRLFEPWDEVNGWCEHNHQFSYRLDDEDNSDGCMQCERDAAVARAERTEAERDAAQHDVKEVAGIFKIVMPRPGTDIAKICLKNAALKRERDALAADLAAARAELGALGKKAAEAVEVAYKSGITDTSSMPGPKIIEQMWQDSTARRAALAIRVVKEAQ